MNMDSLLFIPYIQLKKIEVMAVLVVIAAFTQQ